LKDTANNERNTQEDVMIVSLVNKEEITEKSEIKFDRLGTTDKLNLC
jgi:hypothetical protein